MDAGRGEGRQEASKQFFFEKKNQKTFVFEERSVIHVRCQTGRSLPAFPGEEEVFLPSLGVGAVEAVGHRFSSAVAHQAWQDKAPQTPPWQGSSRGSKRPGSNLDQACGQHKGGLRDPILDVRR